MICNDCGESRCECDIEEELELDCEAKCYITIKYNSANICPEALFENAVRYIIESDGFAKIIDIEIK